MLRHVLVLFSVLLLTSIAIAQNTTESDPQALTLAARAMAALTSGIQLREVSLSASITRTAGSDVQTATGTLEAKESGKSRIEMALSSGSWTEIRTTTQKGVPEGQWSGPDGASHHHAQHNLWTDAAWFFPAFSSLAHVGDPNFVFHYLGQEKRDGKTIEHLRVSQLWHFGGEDRMAFSRLSAIDFLLDSSSLLPLAAVFAEHPDSNTFSDIGAEVRFEDYRAVGSAQVPFHIQRFLNGTRVLDIRVSEASTNPSLSDARFSIR